MIDSWEKTLEEYREMNFHVLTRDNISLTSIAKLNSGIPVSPSAHAFLKGLAQPQMSLWEAFFQSVQHIHSNLREQDIFSPLKQLVLQATNVAVLYGEHPRWASPEKWSYLFQL